MAYIVEGVAGTRGALFISPSTSTVNAWKLKTTQMRIIGELGWAYDDPERIFASPSELAQRDDLTLGQRIGILASWRQKIIVGGAANGAGTSVSDVDAALDLLISQI